MTQAEALRKAQTRSQSSRAAWLVIERTDHPMFPGAHYFYAISESDKRRWTPGETLIEQYVDGETIA